MTENIFLSTKYLSNRNAPPQWRGITTNTTRGIKMKKLLLIGIILLLTGCASSPWGSATSGGASYTYSHTTADGDTCTVQTTSARDIAGGTISIDQDCTLTAGAADATGVSESISAINGLVKRLPLTQ